MQKCLLIIGAGREQIPAYELARRKGLRVVGTDMNLQAPALAFADDALVASTRDADETLRVVSAYARRQPIHGVMTIANDVPLTVAKVAAHLGLPGIPVTAAETVTDKMAMKTCFDRAGIPNPRWKPLQDAGDLRAGVRDLGLPCILKPVDGRGARGVIYLDETVDLGWAWAHALSNTNQATLLLEQFIDGPQLSVEGVFLDRRYHAVAFADRNYSNLPRTKPFIIEDGGVIPSRFEEPLLTEISRLLERGANAVGLSWGSVKGDIVLQDGAPMIIELAARLSGNYLATHHIPMAYGVDMVSVVMDLALGERPNPSRLRPTQRNYLGVRYFFPPPGRLIELRGMESVKSREYVTWLDINLKPGEVQPGIDNHGARAGTIMCQGPDYETAKQRAERCVQDIEFVLA